jgi:hypothetical protein
MEGRLLQYERRSLVTKLTLVTPILVTVCSTTVPIHITSLCENSSSRFVLTEFSDLFNAAQAIITAADLKAKNSSWQNPLDTHYGGSAAPVLRN